jgi:hypothetical protein
MLYINDQLPHILKAKKIHTQYITCYINRKIYGKTPASVCSDATCKICNSKTKKAHTSAYLHSVLEKIDFTKLASSYPQDLFNLNKQFNKLYKKSRKRISDKDQKCIENIFNYMWFIDKSNELYNAYDLCNNLKIETCVYCNRLYTSTIITEKKQSVIRPTLDHWFPQEDFPLLSLSFYNLIPSCSPCNSSIKHNAKFNLQKNIHPYLDKKITNKYNLKSTYDKSLDTFRISIITKEKKIKSTLDSMKIADIYQHHQSELADLDLLKRKYNKSYLNNLGKLLGTRISDKDVYRIMFGVEYEDENFYKRPLSKLKKDILKP